MRFSPALEVMYREHYMEEWIVHFRTGFICLMALQSIFGIKGMFSEHAAFIGALRYGIQLPSWIIGLYLSYLPSFPQNIDMIKLIIACTNVVISILMLVLPDWKESENPLYQGYLIVSYMMLLSDAKVGSRKAIPAAIVLFVLEMVMVLAVHGFRLSSLSALLGHLLLVIMGIFASQDEENNERLRFMLRHKRIERVEGFNDLRTSPQKS